MKKLQFNKSANKILEEAMFDEEDNRGKGYKRKLLSDLTYLIISQNWK